MNKTLLIVVFSLAAGFAAGAMMSAPSGTSGTGTDFDITAPADSRLAALERTVSEERAARLVLEEQIRGLYDELERLDVPELQELLQQLATNREGGQEASIQATQETQSRAENVRRRMRNYDDNRKRRLVSGGFTEAQAAGILQLEDEVRMQALQDEYRAQQDGESVDPWGRMNAYQQQLRDQLGDEDYGKYLEAHGMSASVIVQDVIGSSPANRAGLQAGDRIISYGGERVFGMSELRNMAFGGSPGEDVIVEVDRDGQRLQLVLPRGPMGITGSGGPRGFGYNPYGG